MTDCPHVVGPAQSLVERLSTAEGFLFGFDYDGTLAPIRADPDEPSIPNGLADALQELADRPDTQAAIVSGRGLSDLRNRLTLEGVVLAGNHGLERDNDGERVVAPDVERSLSTIRSICTTLRSEVIAIPGCRVEDKGLTLTVHVRETPPERVDEVRNIVVETAAAHPDVRLTEGKQVFEIRPATDHDKGTTMNQLESAVPDDWITLYLGDDTTDEDAFEAIQPEGIGIHVGTDETQATYRIPSQRDVPAFVDWLTATIQAPQTHHG